MIQYSLERPASEFGNCKVPKTNVVLFNWVGKQQSQHRQGKLFKERYERLVELGFHFDGGEEVSNACVRGLSREEHFENRCQELIEFREEVSC